MRMGHFLKVPKEKQAWSKHYGSIIQCFPVFLLNSAIFSLLDPPGWLHNFKSCDQLGPFLGNSSFPKNIVPFSPFIFIHFPPTRLFPSFHPQRSILKCQHIFFPLFLPCNFALFSLRFIQFFLTNLQVGSQLFSMISHFSFHLSMHFPITSTSFFSQGTSSTPSSGPSSAPAPGCPPSRCRRRPWPTRACCGTIRRSAKARGKCRPLSLGKSWLVGTAFFLKRESFL